MNNLDDANAFCLREFESRKVNKCDAYWVNDHKNVYYEITQENGSFKKYLMKYERNPHYTLGKLKGFKGAGVTINARTYEQFIKKVFGDFLYATPLYIYHISYDNMNWVITEPYAQDYNNEVVVALPFQKLRRWETNISQD